MYNILNVFFIYSFLAYFCFRFELIWPIDLREKNEFAIENTYETLEFLFFNRYPLQIHSHDPFARSSVLPPLPKCIKRIKQRIFHRSMSISN